MNHRKIRKCSALLAVAAVFTFPGIVGAQQSFSIVGTSNVQGLGSADYTVEMDSTAPVEGYVLAISYDPALVMVTDATTAGSVAESAGAELVVPEVLPAGFTIGVVLDATAPFDGQTIPAGVGQNVGTFTAQSVVILNQGDPPVTTNFNFQDGSLNNPPLDNIIVQGGLSIGAGGGLTLNDSDPAAMTIGPPPPAGLEIESASSPSTANSGCARILLDNDAGDTQGFVLSISHNSAVVTLVDINIDGTATEAAGAEFVVDNILAGGGTLGVVLDFNAPFDGQTIAAGQGIHIANYCYSCVNEVVYILGDPAPPSEVSDLTFVDGVFGSPPLSNVVVVGGLSISPDLTNGTFTCEPVGEAPNDTNFFCGPASYEGTDDPENNLPGPIEQDPGSDVEICLFYTDEADNLQGVQLALCYDCNLTVTNFDISGSIFDEVGAEFVNWNADNDDGDGDGCEFVAGILLDALPPFDGQTVPPTSVPLLIGCITATVSETAACDSLLAVEWCDFINGAGSVDIENIAIIDFQSIQTFDRYDCAILVVPEEIFQRGDCNDDDKVDLADAAKILGWQFGGEMIQCADACDANDDGKINLADSVLVLNYMFLFGDPPPDPGPVNGMEGQDPTADDLPECMSDDTFCP